MSIVNAPICKINLQRYICLSKMHIPKENLLVRQEFGRCFTRTPNIEAQLLEILILVHFVLNPTYVTMSEVVITSVTKIDLVSIRINVTLDSITILYQVKSHSSWFVCASSIMCDSLLYVDSCHSTIML